MKASQAVDVVYEAVFYEDIDFDIGDAYLPEKGLTIHAIYSNANLMAIEMNTAAGWIECMDISGGVMDTTADKWIFVIPVPCDGVNVRIFSKAAADNKILKVAMLRLSRS